MNWWEEVDNNWGDLLNLIEKFHPAHSNPEVIMLYPITASNAEKACDSIRNQIDTKLPISIANTAKENRDGETLHRIFNETWFGAPESRDVFYEPCFGLLCDLCSEYEGE